MIEIPVHDRQGKVVETIQFDETCLGTYINYDLLHDYIIMYEANQRQGTHQVKNRRSITGSTRKPHRQKGTGRARMGSRRRVGSVGGAVAHGPVPRDYRKAMNRQMRRQAMRHALLGKFRDSEVIVVSDLKQDAPKTKEVAGTLKAIKAGKTCLVVTKDANQALWKSVRNIANTTLSPLTEMNAYEILRPKTIVMTKDALEALSQEMK